MTTISTQYTIARLDRSVTYDDHNIEDIIAYLIDHPDADHTDLARYFLDDDVDEATFHKAENKIYAALNNMKQAGILTYDNGTWKPVLRRRKE